MVDSEIAGAERGISRRAFGKLAAAAACALPFELCAEETSPRFKLRYVLASAMYGKLPLSEIVPQVRASGADAIDLWPAPHGSQREELDTMGVEKFAGLLRENKVKLEVTTRYDLGPFKLHNEFDLVRSLGGSVIVTGGVGPVGLTGDDLKKAVQEFAEKLKAHVAAAEEKGVKIAIENHGKNIIDSADSIRWLADSNPSPSLGIALAPYHLPQDTASLAQLIGDLGKRLLIFYAWEHGHGCMTKLPKDEELLQMPGRGTLDFTPLLAALKKSSFNGITEIFMHPTPRGIPILDTAAEVTAEINRARSYLDKCLARI